MCGEIFVGETGEEATFAGAAARQHFWIIEIVNDAVAGVLLIVADLCGDRDSFVFALEQRMTEQ